MGTSAWTEWHWAQTWADASASSRVGRTIDSSAESERCCRYRRRGLRFSPACTSPGPWHASQEIPYSPTSVSAAAVAAGVIASMRERASVVWHFTQWVFQRPTSSLAWNSGRIRNTEDQGIQRCSSRWK